MKKVVFYFILSCVALSINLIIYAGILAGFIEPSYRLTLTTFSCTIGFLPPFSKFLYLYACMVDQKSKEELEKKNTYLEHAAKILRHDMHSGINTYMPRGIKGLNRRLPESVIREYKLGTSLSLLSLGLEHTQKVYRGVKEFTNLVKDNAKLQKKEVNLSVILAEYLSLTAYKDQVLIEKLPSIPVNESLFCTAVDNMIRNGLKYNDSDTKLVTIFMYDGSHLAVVDNGRGMTQEEFEKNIMPYQRDRSQKESGTGLGLNISIAILKEHGFKVSCFTQDKGTMLRIKIL